MTFTRKQKRVLSRIFNQGEADPEKLLEFPLHGQHRTLYDVDTETEIEYGIFDFDDWFTDEDIEDWFDENMRISIPSWMYWDCTGCRFTWDIRWKRLPVTEPGHNPVSFIHRIQIDV